MPVVTKLPDRIKNKLRKMQKLSVTYSHLEREINDYFTSCGVDIGNFLTEGEGEEQNEALTYISYGEGDVEENIAEIEKLFLHYVNKER